MRPATQGVAAGLCAGVALLLVPSTALAQLTWRTELAVSGNVTDNIRPPGEEPAEVGFFTTFGPRLGLAMEGTSSVFSLEYRGGVDVYANHLEATSYVNALHFESFFRISDALRLTLGFDVSQGKQSNLLLAGAASVTPLGVQPPAGSLFVAGSGMERLDWEVANVWTLAEDLQVALNRPIDSQIQAASLNLASELSFERRWTVDSLAGLVLPNFIFISYPVTGLLEKQLLLELLVRWRHDFGYSFSGEAQAGALVAMNLDSPSNNAASPAGRLEAHYRREEGWAELSLAHTAEVNGLVGRTYMVEEARLRGGIPILRPPRPPLEASVSAGYQYGRAMLTTGDAESGIHVLLVDAALDWQASANVSVGARYQFTRQAGVDAGFVAFSRHVGLLTVTATYPAEGQQQGIRVPSGRSRRVDRSDADLDDGRSGRRSR